MAGEASQNRSEKATPRRRERARKDGDVAYSNDLTSAAGLVALAVLVDAGGARWGAELGRGIASAAIHNPAREWTQLHAILLGRWFAMHLFLAAGLASAGVLALTVLTGVAQTGFRLTLTPLRLNWERLSISSGWGRLWSPESLARTVGTLLKLCLISIVAGIAVYQQLDALRTSPRQGFRQTAAFGADVVSRVLWAAAAGALAIGLADVAWQRWRREQRLRMSKTDIKQEQKEDGGDPQVRARVRRLQRDVVKRKGLRDIPQATVVITNPTHYAVALKYDGGSAAAPKVVAKGSGSLARLIVRLARKNGVPVIERKPLARALFRYVEIGREIPSEFYQAVAELLAFLYQRKRAG